MNGFLDINSTPCMLFDPILDTTPDFKFTDSQLPLDLDEDSPSIFPFSPIGTPNFPTKETVDLDLEIEEFLDKGGLELPDE